MADASNPAERRRWNDERWMKSWRRKEQVTDAVIPHLFRVAALTPGERVLDVGAGGGRTSLEAARVVGPEGAVVGADISTVLRDLARGRAAEESAGNVRFDVVDVQNADVPGAPFDVAISQFGVMFFDEPVTAFANIARHLRPGGRLVFVCWQGADRNPWNVGPVLAPFLPPVPPPAPGKSATGPFSLADPERTTEILTAAGFATVEREADEITVDLPEDAIVDDDQLAFLGLSDAQMPDARAAIEANMAPTRIAPGVGRFPLAVQIFRAHRA